MTVRGEAGEQHERGAGLSEVMQPDPVKPDAGAGLVPRSVNVARLQQSEQVAPEVLRYDRIARGLVRELLRRARRPRPVLSMMATRAGILA